MKKTIGVLDYFHVRPGWFARKLAYNIKYSKKYGLIKFSSPTPLQEYP